jgi:AcrR family transcriptional regulator
VGFMRARTLEQVNSRHEEIINACDKLLSDYGYEGVTYKAISQITTFTRQSIYTYYKTKDEILVDLLGREVQSWKCTFIEGMDKEPTMSKEQYSIFLTKTLFSHDKMLKLLSILFSVVETNSSEKFLNVIEVIAPSVDKYFPEASLEHKNRFLCAFSVYLLGLYPISHLTQKQLMSGQMTGIDHTVHAVPDIEYLCYQGILYLLSGL